MLEETFNRFIHELVFDSYQSNNQSPQPIDTTISINNFVGLLTALASLIFTCLQIKNYYWPAAPSPVDGLEQGLRRNNAILQTAFMTLQLRMFGFGSAEDFLSYVNSLVRQPSWKPPLATLGLHPAH